MAPPSYVPLWCAQSSVCFQVATTQHLEQPSTVSCACAHNPRAMSHNCIDVWLHVHLSFSPPWVAKVATFLTLSWMMATIFPTTTAPTFLILISIFWTIHMSQKWVSFFPWNLFVIDTNHSPYLHILPSCSLQLPPQLMKSWYDQEMQHMHQ